MDRISLTALCTHLGQHLRRVRGGHTLTVHDRDQPVARIVPYVAPADGPESEFSIRAATRRPADLPLPARLGVATDSLAVLLEDRAAR